MSTNKPPMIHCTKDYSLFIINHLNRDITDGNHKRLIRSMQAHGFIPDFHLICIRLPEGKLGIEVGHHRFHYAKRLGLPIYYTVTETEFSTADAEGDSGTIWTLRQLITREIKKGKLEYRKLLRFADEHKIPIGAAASLLRGQSAGSGNAQRLIRDGTYALGDTTHAESVMAIKRAFESARVDFASGAIFLDALSKVVFAPTVDLKRMERNAKLYGGMMSKKVNTGEMLEQLQTVYNRNAKGGTIPLRYLAEEASKERKRTFGHTVNAKG
jgi:hypothetical protein